MRLRLLLAAAAAAAAAATAAAAETTSGGAFPVCTTVQVREYTRIRETCKQTPSACCAGQPGTSHDVICEFPTPESPSGCCVRTAGAGPTPDLVVMDPVAISEAAVGERLCPAKAFVLTHGACERCAVAFDAGGEQLDCAVIDVPSAGTPYKGPGRCAPASAASAAPTTTTTAAADARATARGTTAASTAASGGAGAPTARAPATPAAPTKADSEPSACFPAAATVALEGGGAARMDELRVGDRVSVGGGRFSPVFMFTHRVAAHVGEFVQIEGASGAALRLTAGHYLYVNGALAAAGSVRAGDAVELGRGGADVVARVTAVSDAGLFNPQTLHGDVVVDGVLASTYTRALAPAVAHAALAPARAAYRARGWSCALLDGASGAGEVARAAAARGAHVAGDVVIA